jgi:hypothetical protein
MHRKGNFREIGYRFLVLRTLLALMLGGLSPTMLIAAQEEQPVAQEEGPVDEQLLEEQPNQEEWLPKGSQASYGDEPDLVFPASHNLFVELPTSDKFGYTWSEVAYSWTDISGQGPLSFVNPDDDYAGPVGIGFPFKFYEKTYTELYVSTDGLVSFEEGVSVQSNQLLPHDLKPNNLIAPLWMDLHTCPLGPCPNKVFTSSSPTRFVIQWTDVFRFGSDDKQTFQVVLYPTEISSTTIKPSPANWGNIRSGSKTATARMG